MGLGDHAHRSPLATHFRSRVRRRKRLNMTEVSRQPRGSCGEKRLGHWLSIIWAPGCPQTLALPGHPPSLGPRGADAASGGGGLGAGVLPGAELPPVGREGWCVRRGLWWRGRFRRSERRQDPGAPSTHTGLELRLDVAQRVKGLVQDAPQGTVSHGL